jgi:DNA repair exonuclease SbcCD ATPase subunit
MEKIYQMAAVESDESQPATPEKVVEKTEQSIRILSNLWDRRLVVLNEYYKERNKKRFTPFKSDESIQLEIKELLLQLSPINEREESVVNILESGAANGADIIQDILPDLDEAEGGADTSAEFNEKIGIVSKIIQRYTEIISTHKDILQIERDLIDNPDEAKFELYLTRMSAFNTEFQNLDNGEIEALKKYFTDIESDLKKIEEAKQKGKHLETLKTSFVSAIVRVAVADVIAGVLVGNPFDNPYFWKLSAATIPSVMAVNYIDYYFKIFTKLTKQINQFTGLKK